MYNPYQNYFAPHIQPNMLPQQQVIQVNGKSSVDTIQLAPNSSVLVMDTSAPLVWLCVSDGVGKVTSTPYDITLHMDSPPLDISGIESRLAALERVVSTLEVSHEPDGSKLESKSDKSKYSSDQKHA